MVRYCSNCGKEVLSDDLICAQCRIDNPHLEASLTNLKPSGYGSVMRLNNRLSMFNISGNFVVIGIIVAIIVGGGLGYNIKPTVNVNAFESTIDALESSVMSYTTTIDSLEVELDNVSDDLNDKTRQYNGVNDDLKQLQAEYDEIFLEYTTLESNYELVSSTDMETLLAEYNAMESDYSSLDDELSTLSATKTRLEQEKEILAQEIYALNNLIKEKNSRIEALETTIETADYIPSPPSEGEPGSSRHFPADMNTEIACTFDRVFSTYTSTVTVLEVIRGKAAWTIIEEANMYNAAPSVGSEYILAKIRFKLVSLPSSKEYYSITSAEFEVVSENGVVYEYDMWLVEPSPTLAADLYLGATHEGWVAFMISEDDEHPVLAFQRDDGSGWFKLN